MYQKMIRKIAVFVLMLLISILPCNGQNGVISSEVVFAKGDYGYHTFRIPAVVQTHSGVILAFAEARKNSASDSGDIDLVLKRSCDGGKTWGDMIVVWDDGGNVCGNPSPVVLQDGGRVLLLMTWNNGSDKESNIHTRKGIDSRRVFFCYSDDEGLTWSKAEDITLQAKDPEWTWYATGPCHAIEKQKAPHKGRIIVPCNHGVFNNVSENKKQYFGNTTESHIIYSDDKGQTWHIGGSPGVGNESTIAETRRGSLILNMRGRRTSEKNDQYRLVAISKDGGKTFGQAYTEKVLIEPVCEGSIINYTKEGKLTSKLLFSNPACMPQRKYMTIRQSDDNGKTWGKALRLSGDWAAYSDMVILSDGNVGIFYETGKEGPYEQIVFKKLSSDLFAR